MKTNLLLSFLLAITFIAKSQTVENANVQNVDGDLIFTFDLMPRESVKELYEVTFTATDGTKVTLLKPKVDNLKNVRPGNQLQFVFSGADNFDNFRGAVDFDIRVKMTYSPIRFVSPEEPLIIKKGQSLDLAWKGGLDDDQYSLVLFKDDQKISTVGEGINGQVYQWSVSKSTKAGKPYQLQLVSNKYPNQTGLTTQLVIKNKIPIVIKVLPVLIIGGVVGVWLNHDNQASGNEFPKPPVLPDK